MAGKIGEFQVIDKLGQGSMGVVYLAQATVMGFLVALKVISPEISEDREFVRRFLREMQVVSTLDHPHIVRALDFGVDIEKDLYFVALEYVEGESLKKILDDQTALPLDRALEIVKRVAEGLQYAHERHLIHRDVKPENILIGNKGAVKLSDFGLVKTDEVSTITRKDVVLGTPYYLPPEQVMGDGEVDIRGDIYSLGATLFHLLTGRPPFLGDSAVELMTAHCQKPFPRLAEFIPQMAPQVEQLLASMTAKDPAQRFSEPAEVSQCISHLQETLGEALHLCVLSPERRSQPAPLSLTMLETMSILKGKTRKVGLTDLIQSLFSHKRTGILTLSEEDRQMEIHFSAGEIIHVQKEDLLGREALVEILREKPARFKFREEKLSSPSNAKGNTMELLMDSLRILDEQGHSSGRIKKPSLARQHTTTSMIGKLNPITPLEVLEGLYAKKETGILSLHCLKERGTIYLDQGQVIHAQTDSAQGESAFFQIVFWTQGLFRFREEPPQVKPTIDVDTLALLIEGGQRLEEYSHS